MKKSPVVHFEMPAKDKARVSKFYTDAFGWEMQVMGPEFGNYVVATTTESDDKGPKNPGAINGGFFERDDNKPGMNSTSVVISVDNLDEAVENVKKAGGEIQGEPMDIPGVGNYVAFHDTEGNRVGLLQPSMG